MAFLFKDLCY